MRSELFKKTMREAEEGTNDVWSSGEDGYDWKNLNLNEPSKDEATYDGPGSWMKGKDLATAMEIYEITDNLYTKCMWACDRSQDEHAKDLFDEFAQSASEIAMPLEMMFNDLIESDRLDSKLAARWNAIH